MFSKGDQFEPNVLYQLGDDSAEFTLPSDVSEGQFYLLEVTGSGKLLMNVFGAAEKDESNNSSPRNTETSLSFYAPEEPAFIPLSILTKGQKLQLKNERGSFQEPWFARLSLVNSIEIEFNSRARVYPLFSDRISFLVSTNDSQKRRK